jgi:hypothetical protein
MGFRNNAFWWGGVYGVGLAVIFFLFEKVIAAKMPPAITHPEFYYGFAGALLVWHLLYIYVANHMERCRPVMIFAVLEKISFAVPVLVLYGIGRVTSLGLVIGAIGDLIWAALFFMAYVKLGSEAKVPTVRSAPA